MTVDLIIGGRHARNVAAQRKKPCKNTKEYLQAKKSFTANQHLQHLVFVLLTFRTERIYILAQDCHKKITQYC